MDRSKGIIRVSILGIAANLILASFKALVGFFSGSIAVVLDAVNNVSDALSSIITIVGTRLAGRAPDKKHPFGHGRIESLSAIVIAVIILIAGVTSFRESIEKIVSPAETTYSVWSLVIIAAAVAVKFFLGRFVKAKGEQYNSESLVASGTDASFDALISFSTLVAALISMVFRFGIEGYLGVIIAIFIMKAGIEILLDSVNTILGARVDSELAIKIRERVMKEPEVRGVYDLILHRYGPEKTIGSFHIEVDDDMTAKSIHELTRRISALVYTEFGIIVTVGIYAANVEDEAAAEMKQFVLDTVSAHPEVIQMHAFYREETPPRVTFDLIVAFGSDAGKVRDEIVATLKEKYPDYTFDVVLDTDFSES